MRIRIARSAGFCFGVRRALEHAEQALEEYGTVCSLGELIHNPDVVDTLREKGVNVINEICEARGRPVLIRSHGVAPEVLQSAREQGVTIIDATCPFVRRVQERALDLERKDYQVVVVGSAEHPEVRGILGWTGYKAVVVHDLNDVGRLQYGSRIGVLSQTTQARDRFYMIARELVSKAREVRIYDTICKASVARQDEAVAMASCVDMMVVIGGRKSANTCELVKICQQYVPAIHIENAAELEPSIFKGIGEVGVTAGASTPDWIIEEVVRGMSMIDEDLEKTESEFQEIPSENPQASALQDEAGVAEGAVGVVPDVATENTIQDATPENDTSTAQDSPKAPLEPGQDEVMSLDFSGAPSQIQDGDIISGTVVRVRDDEVLIDIGGKSEGVIPRQELSLRSVEHPGDVVKEGDVFDVYVLRADTDEGHMLLSKKKADHSKALDKLEHALETREELAGEVIEVVKGGLLVDVLGMQGFVPASLVERGYVGELDKYVGKTLRLRVIEFDQGRGKVVLSQKAILQEEYLQAQKELWETIQPGEIRKGTVRHLTNFGAFMDLGGVDGLLHISELSWGRVKHPSEVVHEGDEADVYVIAVDRENKKISLSLKQAQASPWKAVGERYSVGQIIKGSVVRIVSFGAFIEIEPGVEGLVHISRIADFRVAKAEDVLSPGQVVDVKIMEINEQDQRISLSIKDAIPADERAETVKRPAREARNDRESFAGCDDKEVSQNLGDMFGALLRQAEQK